MDTMKLLLDMRMNELNDIRLKNKITTCGMCGKEAHAQSMNLMGETTHYGGGRKSIIRPAEFLCEECHDALFGKDNEFLIRRNGKGV